MNKSLTFVAVACLGTWCCAAAPARGEDFDRPPIEYSARTPANRVSRLVAELEDGTKSLRREPKFGYLRDLLTELDVPQSSQTLVFSKTSLQRSRITARTPRALYFSDDVYVGFCQDGEVLEISAVDDELGTVFYTLDQTATDDAPPILRQSDNCLICHASSATRGMPGHLVRSLFVDASGLPILSSGSYRTDQTSPLAERWGGWYVTGTHGSQKHLGNMIARGREPERADNTAGQNVTDLSDRFNTKAYLTPHSDIVALMVMEHQTTAHNHIVEANFATRQALDYEASLNRELGEPADKRWDSTNSRIRAACEPLVEYLFFCDEAPLAHPIAGTSRFAEEFSQLGPRDKRGRSLRDFDLERRMFRHPLSYLVYSSSFQSLPGEARAYVYRRMKEILSGADESGKFTHLSADDRRAIREILADTLPGFSM
jgi:hypothetical protein